MNKKKKIKLLIEETRHPRKKRTFKIKLRNFFIFVLIFVVLSGGLAMLAHFAVMPAFTRQGEERILLNVEGLSWEEARYLLLLEKFTPMRGKSIPREDMEPFRVISQMPRPGSRVKMGRRVYLDVSIPLENVVFPDLKGKTLRTAQILMEEKNLNIDSVSYGFSELPREVIFWQSVPAGETVRPGTHVHIKISLGLSSWTVPNITNISLQEAHKIINDAGLRIGTVTYRDRNDLLPNTVIYQSVPGASVLSVPQAIDLVVSRYNENEPQ
ncbi:MAG: PASTA domain-containing protein [Candidatus Neomarinimicrobiota bacterium]|jgi:serine/threonine-protein kinase|nr:PASTA domain-containing protein [Candidatus Neomarinimicrobiota bacterium]MDX9781285.1 PASTA domain-containing protein [bacterium]